MSRTNSRESNKLSFVRRRTRVCLHLYHTHTSVNESESADGRNVRVREERKKSCSLGKHPGCPYQFPSVSFICFFYFLCSPPLSLFCLYFSFFTTPFLHTYPFLLVLPAHSTLPSKPHRATPSTITPQRTHIPYSTLSFTTLPRCL